MIFFLYIILFRPFKHPPPPAGSFMTMSGKVIVKFLKPIHEREVQGPNFSLFQGSGSVRKKVVCSVNKDSVLFGGGLGEELCVEDMAERGEGKTDRNGQSLIRDRMSRLVRYRILQVSYFMSHTLRKVRIRRKVKICSFEIWFLNNLISLIFTLLSLSLLFVSLTFSTSLYLSLALSLSPTFSFCTSFPLLLSPSSLSIA